MSTQVGKGEVEIDPEDLHSAQGYWRQGRPDADCMSWEGVVRQGLRSAATGSWHTMTELLKFGLELETGRRREAHFLFVPKTPDSEAG